MRPVVRQFAAFVPKASGKNFNPHVTVGIATVEYLKPMLAEPFAAFTFSPAGASLYDLGTYGTGPGETQAAGFEALREKWLDRTQYEGSKKLCQMIRKVTFFFTLCEFPIVWRMT